MIRYTCKRESLPMVEGALAANGYTIQIPLQKHADRMIILMMNPGVAIVFLVADPSTDHAEIEVYGAAQSVVGWLLETLPVPLDRHLAPNTPLQNAA